MNDADLLTACKIGLGIPTTSTVHNATLIQKLRAVKSFMQGAGVSDTLLADDLAVGVIVVGVTDIWNLTAGDIKFSKVFYVLLNQLSVRSLPDPESDV